MEIDNFFYKKRIGDNIWPKPSEITSELVTTSEGRCIYASAFNGRKILIKKSLNHI
jgi:hypothetical protein